MSESGGTGRLALGVEYDGGGFVGWQRQSEGRSVQAEVEAALSRVADAPVSVTCAGRTDAGVHALEQVVHFDPPPGRTLRNWVLGANANLSREVAVRWAHEVPPEFHARYGARSRRYLYLVAERRVRPVLVRRNAAWERGPLDLDSMRAAAGALLGEHDFSAFRAAGCQARTPVRTLLRLDVFRCANLVGFDVVANAFLHHMVRIMAGSLLAVGRGEWPAKRIGEILQGGDRTRAGPTAPACGLTLISVDYPERYGLPRATGADGDLAVLGL